ncbi:MAG: hypothetical protein GY953_14325 [bacterium]|nr:hypothetical protein [bacterium]
MQSRRRAKRFYAAFGFRPSPVNPMTLMITLAEVERILSADGIAEGR